MALWLICPIGIAVVCVVAFALDRFLQDDPRRQVVSFLVLAAAFVAGLPLFYADGQWGFLVLLAAASAVLTWSALGIAFQWPGFRPEPDEEAEAEEEEE
jgi:hypothetical protein